MTNLISCWASRRGPCRAPDCIFHPYLIFLFSQAAALASFLLVFRHVLALVAPEHRFPSFLSSLPTTQISPLLQNSPQLRAHWDHWLVYRDRCALWNPVPHPFFHDRSRVPRKRMAPQTTLCIPSPTLCLSRHSLTHSRVATTTTITWSPTQPLHCPNASGQPRT